MATLVAACCAAPVAEPNFGFYGAPVAYGLDTAGAYPYAAAASGFPTAYSSAVGFGATDLYSGGYAAPVASAYYGGAFPVTFL